MGRSRCVARRPAGRIGRPPADYVAEHLDLGYAVTSHRAQGITVDTSHVRRNDAAMTRENLYVALTRGRQTNLAYVAIDKPDDSHDGPHPGDNTEATARSVLFGVLTCAGAELSAHRRPSPPSKTLGRTSANLPESTRRSPPPRNVTAGSRSSAPPGSPMRRRGSRDLFLGIRGAHRRTAAC